LTTLTLGLRVKRVQAVVVDVVVIFAGSIYFMLIADSFYGPFIGFISLLAVPITAWVGIFVVDLLHRQYYSPTDLLDVTPSSTYWYKGGIEPRAFGAWALAIIIGFCFLSTGSYHGVFANSWFGRNGLGWVMTFAIAAIAISSYGAGHRRSGDASGRLTCPRRRRACPSLGF
jgi:purine-cytosine permease-like protein